MIDGNGKIRFSEDVTGFCQSLSSIKNNNLSLRFLYVGRPIDCTLTCKSDKLQAPMSFTRCIFLIIFHIPIQLVSLELSSEA
ncbi:unnamed protein product [Albugo candida]|uniref:Uncharacterized protein n=1 Tax=Albugo candida TaxID=65357 RepID=A0A024GN77_9STRA|nr:unnamed protein product [Albugo candida]|eukprot:CCI47955.1 unnamed protein product [Albugo candida]